MRTIAIYFTKPNFDDYPFDDPEYRGGYELIGSMITEKGGRCCIVRGDTYKGNNEFSRGWEFRDGKYVAIDVPIRADIIFNKGRTSWDANATIINDPQLDTLCTDKSATYKLFATHSPMTVVVRNAKELEEALEKIPGELVVTKPLDGEGGKGVTIGDRATVTGTVSHYPFLIQQLIDTSGGIPGLTDSRHDLRVIIVEGEIVGAFLRTPKEGSYVSNVSQGGSIREVPVDHLPEGAEKIVADVEKEFSRFPKHVYSVDMGRDKSGTWKIIELNAQPGLSIADYKEGSGGKRLFERIVSLLLRP